MPASAAPSVKAAQDVVVRGAGGQAVHAAGPVGLRQDHDAALDRRAGAADRGRDRGRRARGLFVEQGHFRRAEQAQFRHGVPVLRDLAAHERVPERGLPARGAQAAQEGDPRQGHARAAGGRARRAGRPRRHQALRRPAAAAGARARAGDGAAAPAARRAAVQSRRQAARPHALRAQAAAARSQPHHRLRHPRPERGAGAVARDRGDERGPHRPGRHAAPDLRAADRTSSSPISSAPPISSAAPSTTVDGRHAASCARPWASSRRMRAKA